MKQELTKFNKAVDDMTKLFVKKYFNIDADYYWIGETTKKPNDGDRSGVLCVNDYFFNLTRIVEAIKYNVSSKKLFDYYEQELDFLMKEKPMKINFVNYIKFGNLYEKTIR